MAGGTSVERLVKLRHPTRDVVGEGSIQQGNSNRVLLLAQQIIVPRRDVSTELRTIQYAPRSLSWAAGSA